MNRKRPRWSSGWAADMLISPRDFLFTVCWECSRYLYYTDVGDPCPFCGTTVLTFVEGNLPQVEPVVEQPNRPQPATRRRRRGGRGRRLKTVLSRRG